MLNREVCKRCLNVYAACVGSVRLQWKWEGIADQLWDNSGIVNCFPTGVMRAKVDGEPPKGCEYATEHVVSQRTDRNNRETEEET